MIDKYISLIVNNIHIILQDERDKIVEVARKIYNSLENGGILHIFGTGHSNLLAQDLVYRAGGLVPINIISTPSLTLEHDPIKAAKMEKIPGISEVLFTGLKTRKNDVFIIISTSGCNAVTVEMAQIACENGLFVVGITSKKYSEYIKEKRKLRRSLYDIADIAIDNKVEVGDCCLETDGNKFGTMSTILVSSILNCITVEVLQSFIIEGKELPIFVSNNMFDNSNQRNIEMIKKYSSQLDL